MHAQVDFVFVGIVKFYVYWILFLLFNGITARSARVDQMMDEDILIPSARCAVRCLAVLKSRLALESVNTEVLSLTGCRQYDSCAMCLEPCNRLFLNSSSCRQSCSIASRESVRLCQDSCSFLGQVTSLHPGVCPPASQSVHSQCTNSCDSDTDCPNHSKCCSVGCGRSCHLSINQGDVPRIVSVVERNETNSVVVTWTTLDVTELVLYIVQSRWHVGRLLAPSAMIPWRTLDQVTTPYLVVDDLKPGHWYQFQVSAVNQDGRLVGVSQPSQPFTLSRGPGRPGPPVNVTEGNTVITEGGIAVSIHWSPPRNTDIPVGRYKIFWSKRLKAVSPQLESLEEHRQVLPADRNTFEIHGLEPDTTYFIQVQAICQYGEMRLKSEKSSLYITTFVMPTGQGSSSFRPVDALQRDSTAVPSSGLGVGDVFFQNGLLKANVSWDFEEVSDIEAESVEKVLIYWSAESCTTDTSLDEMAIPAMSATTHDSHFIIYDLRFKCRYRVRVQPVLDAGSPSSWFQAVLYTPLCSQVAIVGDILPDCPSNPRRVPDEPTDLRHSFVIVNTNITTKLSWGAPTSDLPITGYQVTWGRATTGNHHTQLDKSTATAKHLPKMNLLISTSKLKKVSQVTTTTFSQPRPDIRSLSTAQIRTKSTLLTYRLAEIITTSSRQHHAARLWHMKSLTRDKETFALILCPRSVSPSASASSPTLGQFLS